MSRPELDPLDPDLDALLETERRRPSVAPDVHERVLAQVVATLGTPGPGGGDPGGAPSPPPVPPAAGAGGLLAKPILLGAALGGLVAAGIVARPDAPAPAPRPAVSALVVASAPVARGAAPAEREAPRAAPERAPEPAIKAPAPPRASADDPAADHDGGLAAERRLLDEAQRDLAAGNGAAALDALGRHAAEFPRGRLREEREGLWIRALARAGRLDEARARASRFRASFPGSLLLPSLEATIGEIP
jgi:hypothetical protein